MAKSRRSAAPSVPPPAEPVSEQRRRRVRATGPGLPDKTLWERVPGGLQHAICVLALLLVATLFFAPLHFGGRTLVGGDTIQWRAAAESMIQYERETGAFALWETNMFGGMPGYLIYYKNAVPQADSVLRALREAGFWPGAHLFALMLGVYLVLFHLTRTKLPGVLAGIAFGLTTYIPIILVAGHNTKFVAMAMAPWLVLAFLFALRPAPASGWMRLLLGALLFAVALAVNLRADHVQITYYTAFLLGIWWIVDGINSVRLGQTRVFLLATAALGLGSILGLLMVAQPYLPIAEYRQFTPRGGGEGGGGLDWGYAMSWSQGFGELVTLLIPGAYGGEGPMGLGRGYWGPKIFTAGPHYAGIVVVMLAVVALLGMRRRVIGALGAGGLLMVMFALGEHLPLVNRPMYEYFPFFNAFRVPETWLAIVVLAVAMLGGLGAYFLMRREVSEESDVRKTRVAHMAVGGVLAVLLVLMLARDVFFDFQRPGELEQVQRAVAQQAGATPEDPQVVAFARQYLEQGRQERRDKYAADALRALILAALAGGLIVAYRRRMVAPWAMVVGLIVLTTFDLWSVGRRYFHDQVPALRDARAPEAAIPTYGFDRFIRDRVAEAGGTGHVRALSFESDPSANARPAFHYQTVGGYHGAKLQLIQDYFDHMLFDRGGGVNRNALDLMGTRYLVTRGGQPGQQPVFTDEQTGMVVIENPGALPRAFFVDEFVVIEDRVEAMARVTEPAFDIRRRAVLHEPPPFEADPGAVVRELPPPPTAPEAPAPTDTVAVVPAGPTSVELIKYNNREIDFQVETDRARLLVIGEVYYPAGWRGFVDDQEVPIVRVNHLMRGIWVPEGRHLVAMQFEPDSHRLGVTIASISTLLVYMGALLLIGLMWYRRGRHDE
jgi:hypothetical protein